MVEVVSLGHAAFKITGKTISIVCDPFNEESVGLKFPKVEADVVTISHDHSDHNNRTGVKGDYICFDTPGEYEIKNTEVVGINSYHDENQGADRGLNTIFVYEIDGIKLCHLGNLGHALTSEQIEKIDGIDILFIPVDGKVSLDSKKAAKVIAEIDPKIVIPMHYKSAKKPEFDDVDVFLKELGKDPIKAKELKLKQKELPENLEIYLLTPKSK